MKNTKNTKAWNKELLIGIGIALAIFLAVQGVDILAMLFFGGLVWLLLSRLSVPGMKMAGSTVSPTAFHPVSFDDIGGQKAAKQELREALDLIKDEGQAAKLGIRPLKGILLVGPPGTGKTLLAKAAATYTDSVFMSASGSEFIEMYAGVGAQRVRQLFSTARDTARKQGRKRAVVFIDEIEVMGGKRGQYTSHMEYDQTLNALLVEMDGLKTDEDCRLLVVGATNRPDMLDSALTRPGRFDRVVRVDNPDKDARLQILALHTRNKPMAADVTLDKLAAETQGFSGAHLESLCNEAAIMAMRAGRAIIEMKDFEESVDKVMMGERLDRRPLQEELRRIAIHELGHAFVQEWTRPGSVSAVSILSRGNALGYMRENPQDDQYLRTKAQIEDELSVSLAGALAEEIFLGDMSTGNGGDYEHAVQLCRQYIAAGLSPLGVIDEKFTPKEKVHEAEQNLLRELDQRTRAFLNEKADALKIAWDLLMEQEHVTGADLDKLLNPTDAEAANY
jgi:vesicle-fusing ATPase